MTWLVVAGAVGVRSVVHEVVVALVTWHVSDGYGAVMVALVTWHTGSGPVSSSVTKGREVRYAPCNDFRTHSEPTDKGSGLQHTGTAHLVVERARQHKMAPVTQQQSDARCERSGLH